MSAAVEDVSSGGADSELDCKEGEVAVFEEAGHECVSFSGNVESQPEECKLSVEPVEREQEQAFREWSH